MPLVLVKLQLPFRIALPDDRAFQVLEHGERTTIAVRGGQAERRTVFAAVPEGDDEAERVWYRAVHPVDGAEVPNREYRFNQSHDPFTEEVRDHFAYSDVDVIFEADGDFDDADDEGIETLQREALRRLGILVSAYAEISDEVDIFLPSVADIPAHEIHVADEYTFNDEGVEANFRRHSRRVSWTDPAIVGLLKPNLDADKIRELAIRLRDAEEPPLHLQLLLEARALAHIHQNHRLAIVVGGTSFEVYLQFRLQKACEARGITALPVGRGATRKLRPVAEALSSASLRDELLGVYCEMLTDDGIRSSPQHQDWYSKAYEPRKEIVHGGRLRVTRQEALDALNSIVTFVNYINEQLHASHSDESETGTI